MSNSDTPHISQNWNDVVDRIPPPHNKHFKGSWAEREADGSLLVYLSAPTANVEMIEARLENVIDRALISVYGATPQINYQQQLPALSEPIPPPPPIRDTLREFALLMAQERAEKDIISFKRVFVDMCDGDTLTGLLLSQIVFWHTPNKDGKSKLRVHHDNEYWIAKTREDWEKETTIRPRQLDRCVKKLLELNLVIKKTYKFNGNPTMHLRINPSAYLDAYHAAIRE